MIEMDPEKNPRKFLQDNPLPVGDEFYPLLEIVKNPKTIKGDDGRGVETKRTR